jgi:predicted component of type VI protein secretion system
MWDTGGEAEPGTREIVALFDDPLEKAAHWIRQGARLLDVSRDNLPACARWLKLFGVDAEHWAQEKWYALALLLPNLHRLAGKEAGIRLALQTLAGLPLRSIRQSREFTRLGDRDLSRLGQKSSRLGRDAVLGDRFEDLECLTLVIGPVSLATYNRFQAPEKQRDVDSMLMLSAPCYHRYRIQWIVDYEDRSPRLGQEHENARLGINSRMGQLYPGGHARRGEAA